MINLFIFSSVSLFTSNCIKTKPFYRQVFTFQLCSQFNIKYKLCTCNSPEYFHCFILYLKTTLKKFSCTFK